MTLTTTNAPGDKKISTFADAEQGDKKISTFADAEVRLAESLPGYESRSQQQALARAVEVAIAAGTGKPRTHLVAEAGCGCGKSLGYLIPAILSGKRTLVSTATKALQEQVCVAPSTRILTADLCHIRADEVYVGQSLVGFDEERNGSRRRYRNSVVESVATIERPCYEVEFDDGTTVVCSQEHKWLVGQSMGVKWMTTEQLCPTSGKRPGSKVIRLSDVWETDTSWAGGYLAGLYDGEGCLQLLPKFNPEMLGSIPGRKGGQVNGQRVVRKTFVGMKPVVAIKTSTRTYIAEGLASHNCNKDLPFLAANLGVPFTYAVLKGRSNYLCPSKMKDCDPGDVPSMPAIVEFLEAKVVEAADAKEAGDTGYRSFEGTRESFPFEIPTVEWMRMASDSDDCENCKSVKNAECFAEQARCRAKGARIVVVNHALYLTELAVKDATDGWATFLGPHSTVVFDEAHELEEYASSTLGATFKESGVRAMVAEANNFARRYCGSKGQRVEDVGDAVLGALTDLWSVLKVGRIRVADLTENADQFVNMANALGDFVEVLSPAFLLDETPSALLDKAKKQKTRLFKRADNTSIRFVAICAESFQDLVRWVEEETRRGIVRKVLKSAPVNVAPFLRENLFNVGICRACDGDGTTETGAGCKPCKGTGEMVQVTAILTSATMAVNGTMAYITARLGIDNHIDLDVGSPFNFSTQARLYVPRHLPDPTPVNRAAWSSMMVAEIADLVRASRGRALLLFTSNAQMRLAYDSVSKKVPFTCMMQGQAPNAELAARFTEDVSSVLFATRSFMTGVDFQGEACSLVIIDKLPFPVPTDPLVEARCDAIKAQGGSDFRDYTIPVMSLVLKQAFGRLVRHRNDTGTVAILDPRLLTKGYGKTILNSLPPATRITEPDEVTAFFTAVA